MERFVRGELDVLVATTVVEVGVDVANASVMVVLDAQRYGLAQLHQLRGRVGRGAAKSYCILVYPDDAARDASGSDILTRSTDGFEIAEEDLRLARAGRVCRARPSRARPICGSPTWCATSTSTVPAKADAEEIVAADPALARPRARRAARRCSSGSRRTRALLLSS